MTDGPGTARKAALAAAKMTKVCSSGIARSYGFTVTGMMGHAEPSMAARQALDRPGRPTTSRRSAPDADGGARVLETLGITERSVLGALAVHTGGLSSTTAGCACSAARGCSSGTTGSTTA